MNPKLRHMVERDLTEVAKEYVETLRGQANAHGQHIHPVYGMSHMMLYLMHVVYGVDPANDAITAALGVKA